LDVPQHAYPLVLCGQQVLRAGQHTVPPGHVTCVSPQSKRARVIDSGFDGMADTFDNHGRNVSL
jgi:hypothetical protein